jgi:hypothetical protein
MPTTDLRRRRGPKPDRRRALELLASCRDGCTESILIARRVRERERRIAGRAGIVSIKRET